jgi:aminoglycoside phosphotransferase (APT) family kinase protein
LKNCATCFLLLHLNPEPQERAPTDGPERLNQADVVGRGFTSDVYAWGPGRVLKLFHAWVPHERAERELLVTRAVYAAGLPVPKPYELLLVGGRAGIVFERVEGISMLAHFQKTPWRLFAAIGQLADLQARMHGTPGPLELPSQRDRLAMGIEKSSVLSAPEKEAACAALAGLPDGTAICHGDFHPENVLFTGNGPVIIDWSSGSRGDPLGDVACTARLIRIAKLPPWTPAYMHHILKCSRILLHRAYTRKLLRHYRATRQQIRAWEVPLSAAATFWRVPEGSPGTLPL